MAQKRATTGSVDGCSVLPETQFVPTFQRVDTTRALSLEDSLAPMGVAGERPEFEVKPPLGVPLLMFSRGYLLKCFPRGGPPARQQGFDIKVFTIPYELPKVIEPHLPLPMENRSRHVIFVYDQLIRHHRRNGPRVDIPREILGPATGRFTCNCPVPEDRRGERSRQGNEISCNIHIYVYINQ